MGYGCVYYYYLSTFQVDGMVTDRFYMCYAVQRLDATLDSDIVTDSQ